MQKLTYNTEKLAEDNSILDYLYMELFPSHSRYKSPLTSEKTTRLQWLSIYNGNSSAAIMFTKITNIHRDI